MPFTGRAVTTGKAPVNLQGNFWDEPLTAEMEAKGENQNIPGIRDIFDDISLGKADYSGWLSAPVAGAGPDR